MYSPQSLSFMAKGTKNKMEKTGANIAESIYCAPGGMKTSENMSAFSSWMIFQKIIEQGIMQ